MKTRIHVNKQRIQQNRKYGKKDPVITCKTYKDNRYGHEAIIYGQDGKPAARVIYSPDKPLSCGARLWIETENQVDVKVLSESELNNSDRIENQCDTEENTNQPLSI